MTEHRAEDHKTLDWAKVERLLIGLDVRTVGNVDLRDCTYCEACGTVIVDRKVHGDFHVALVAILRELRRQSEKD